MEILNVCISFKVTEGEGVQTADFNFPTDADSLLRLGLLTMTITLSLTRTRTTSDVFFYSTAGGIFFG